MKQAKLYYDLLQALEKEPLITLGSLQRGPPEIVSASAEPHRGSSLTAQDFVSRAAVSNPGWVDLHGEQIFLSTVSDSGNLLPSLPQT